MVTLERVQSATGAGEASGKQWGTGKLSTSAMDREFKNWLYYRNLVGLPSSDKKQLRGAFFRGVRQGFKQSNPSGWHSAKAVRIRKVGRQILVDIRK